MHAVFLTAAAALLASLPAAEAAFYSKNSPVLQVTSKTFDQLINQSNHTSIVEFYAPWCGHCQNLKPAYEKAAKSLDGLATVAAVDCDDDANKPLCAAMGVQGFPTLKLVRPGKKTGHPAVSDYQGARTAAALVEAVVAQINNHVAKVTDKDADAFLAAGDGPKALLFTNKGTTSPLLKSVAIDFLGVVAVGQVRSKESATVARFGIETFPTLVLLPGGGGDDQQQPLLYTGTMKKDPVVAFLSQAGAPHARPVAAGGPAKGKPKTSKSASNAKASKKAAAAAAAAAADDEPETKATPASAEQTAPVLVESAVPIPTIHTPEKLLKACLHDKAPTCVLAFVPAAAAAAAASQPALDHLAELAHKYAQGKRHLFPLYAVPASNAAAAPLLQALGLDAPPDAHVQLVAINARRGWWRRHGDDAGDGALDPSYESIERWVDAIRMGEGAKKKLPDGIVSAAEAEAKEEVKAEARKEEAPADEPADEPVDEPAAQPEIRHVEL